MSSATIATVFGTKVRMHFTFPLLLVWVAFGEAITRGAQAAVTGVIFVLMLFMCVVAHEFGHILAARRYGGRTRDILLLPIGGVSRMERMPENSREELVVALAGPAVSITIGITLSLFVGFPTPKAIASPAFGALLPRLAAANLLLALFNLLPAFPLDGGRALRAALSVRLGRVRATKLAAGLGHGFALLFVLLGLISGNPIILLIGIFVYFGASAEAAATEVRELARALTVSDVMRTNMRTLTPEAPLSDAIHLMLQAGQHVIPVIDSDGTFVGAATKDGLIRALHRSGKDASMSEAMTRSIPIVPIHRKLMDAIELMQGNAAPAILVVSPRGELAGVVTPETIADLLLVETKADVRIKPRPTSLTVSVPKSV